MVTFKEWCKHYGYEPKAEQSKADYQRYVDQLNLLTKLTQKKENQALPQKAPPN